MRIVNAVQPRGLFLAAGKRRGGVQHDHARVRDQVNAPVEGDEYVRPERLLPGPGRYVDLRQLDTATFGGDGRLVVWTVAWITHAIREGLRKYGPLTEMKLSDPDFRPRS